MVAGGPKGGPWSRISMSGRPGSRRVRAGITSRDGVIWTAPRRVTRADGKPLEGIIEQDPRAIHGGRIVTAFHVKSGLIVAPYYTDDPLGLTGRTRGRMANLPFDGATSREMELASTRAPMVV